MKISSPVFMYHVSPQEARHSIETYGLKPDYDTTGFGAIYLSVEPLGAEHDTDTWKVYVKGLDLLPDMSTPGFEGDWFMTSDPIPPERLRLMEPEHELDEYGDIYAAVQEDWEGPSNDPKDFQPGDQVEYLWSNRPMFGYIKDGPFNFGSEDDPVWFWSVLFDGGISKVRDNYLIPAVPHSLHEPEDEVDEAMANELWPDTFPSHWSATVDFGDHWDNAGMSFIYDANSDMLYLGRNHMAIFYKMTDPDAKGRYGPSFVNIQKNWNDYYRPGLVMGWIHDDHIELYSDIALGQTYNPGDEEVRKAVHAIETEFGRKFDVDDRRGQKEPYQPQSDEPQPLPDSFTSVIISAMDLSNLQSMLSNDAAASAAFDALTQAGGHVYIVGGAVRDAALGNDPKDIDLMVTGLTGDQIEQALSQVGRVDFTGKAFGVYRLRTGAHEVEVAMPRTEQSTGAAHTDFQVNADPNIPVETDLGRRDFTVNAMAYDPITDEVIDPYGGLAHANQRRLSLVNENAFADDPLRVARALTAVSKHGLVPDENIQQSMSDHAASLNHLPGERIQMEMDKLLSGKNPAEALQLAYNTGVMEHLAPELSAMRGFDQKNPHHDMTVDQHTLAALDKMTQITNDPDLRLAILFHDAGKPESFWQDETKGPNGGGHFYKKVLDDGTSIGQDHQDVGADLARAFMERNRYPKARIDRVEKLIRMHMFPYLKSEKAARKFLREAGDPKTAWDLLKIREADSSGKNDKTENQFDKTSREHSEELLRNVIDKEHATSVKDLAINGRDLMEAGVKPGPEMGRILNTLLDRVVENPELNTRDALLGMVPYV